MLKSHEILKATAGSERVHMKFVTNFGWDYCAMTHPKLSLSKAELFHVMIFSQNWTFDGVMQSH